MVENKSLLERLYLVKGDSDDSNIYVDTIRLPQHQYDGVRYLYRQFKKGKSGVILNDPSGYGKRVQAVLFVNALSPIMSQPTLVLCADGSEDAWMQLFYKWTNIGSATSVQQGSEFTKSSCLVGTFSQLPVLARREWGLVVVDDNNVSRDVLRATINACYRIWLTNIDMKKNLQTFALIYKWLYPRDRFIVEEFQTTKKTPTAILTKSTRLDAFLEDIVIRRRGAVVPLGEANQTPDPPRVTRKNKDATGKKIKRSKPLPSYHDTSGDSEGAGSKSQERIPVGSKNGDVGSKKESTEDFVVNIENEGPEVKKDNVFFLTPPHNMEEDNIFTLTPPEDVISDHDVDNGDENDDNEKYSKNKSEDENKIQDKSDEEDVVFNNADNDVPKSDSVTKPNSQDDSLTTLNSDSVLSPNMILKYDSDTPPDLDEIFNDDIPAKKPKIANEIDIIANYKINEVSASEDLFPMDTTPSDNNSETKVNNHDKNNVHVKTNESDVKNSDSNTVSADIPTKEVNNEINKDNLKCNKNLDDKINVSEKSKTEPKLDGVELKMKEMEELAKKKFKGSLLDSIF